MARGVHQGDIIDGKYRVERLLGRGGMGLVVEATHLTLGTTVAIKVLTKSRCRIEEVEQLVREAQVAARLKSDHVVRIFDAGLLESGAPFVVMEHLIGRSLHETIIPGAPPMPVADAVDIVLQICDALEEAHAHGIVHRDLKPGNVFLSKLPNGRETAKVLDFGIAKLLRDAPASILGAPSSVDDLSAVVGTPEYMAPEQFTPGRKATTAIDIWGLGVILYELLTSRRPFDARAFPELVWRITTMDPVMPRTIRPEVPEGLNAIVKKCLVRDPEKRANNAAALAAELRQYGRDTRGPISGPIPMGMASTAHPMPPPSAARRLGMVVAGLALAAAAAFGVVRGPQLAKQLQHPTAASTASPAVEAPALPVPSPVVVTMRGSSTVGEMAPALGSAIATAHPETTLRFEATSSGSGLGALARHEIDLAGASRPATAEEIAFAHGQGSELVEHVIARDALAIVVHPENRASSLSLEQLRGILTGKITNWSQVGGRSLPIRVLTRGEDQGSHEIIKTAVFHPGDAYTEHAEVVRKTEDVVEHVRMDPAAIGFVTSRATGPTKTLALKINPKTMVTPSAATIRSGRYPLRRDLYLYTRRDVSPGAQAVLGLLLDPSSRIAAEAGFVPLDRDATPTVR